MDAPFPNEFAALAAHAAGGDAAAMDMLLRRTIPVARNMLRAVLGDREDSEDVLQEVLWEVWSSVHRLRDPAKFLGWVSRIVVFRARDAIRRRSRPAPTCSLEQTLDPEQIPDASTDGSLEAILNRESAEVLDRLVENLPERYRGVVRLWLFGGLAAREIADRTGRGPSTTRSLLRRGLQRLEREWRRVP